MFTTKTLCWLLADDFNQFFTSVGRNATAASVRLAEHNNIELSSPLSTLSPYSTGEQFNLRPVTSALKFNVSFYPDAIQQVTWS